MRKRHFTEVDTMPLPGIGHRLPTIQQLRESHNMGRTSSRSSPTRRVLGGAQHQDFSCRGHLYSCGLF